MDFSQISLRNNYGINKRQYIIDLYDLYGVLLTDKQREYFEDYYFMDLSITEMAENYSISRNGVHDQLKRSVNALEEYESKLHLYLKFKKIDSMDINPNLKEELLSLLKE